MFGAPDVDVGHVADVNPSVRDEVWRDFRGGAGEDGPDGCQREIEVFRGGGELRWGPHDERWLDGGDGEGRLVGWGELLVGACFRLALEV